jgi:hypothetical protein
MYIYTYMLRHKYDVVVYSRRAPCPSITGLPAALLALLALLRLRSTDKLLRNEALLALLASLACKAVNVPESG